MKLILYLLGLILALTSSQKEDINSVLERVEGSIKRRDNYREHRNIAETCPPRKHDLYTNPVSSSSTATTVRPTTQTSTTPTTTVPVTATKDCKDVDIAGNVKSGMYKLELAEQRSIKVYCSAGFVTMQRRFSGAVSFDRKYGEYQKGFGKVSGEHWLGLIYQHELTKTGSCSLRILLDIDRTTQRNREKCGSSYKSDCDGKTKEILATSFRVLAETDLYRVQVTWNSSDFTHPDVKVLGMDKMNGLQFSAKNKGAERSQCAGGGDVPGGFWYDSGCGPGYPNTVITTTDTNKCSSSNKVCGYWRPYWFTSSWIQFRC